MFLPYVHDTAVNWFSKETDYLFRTKAGQLIIAGFFKNMDEKWELMEAHTCRVINPDSIATYMVIPQN